MPGSRPRKASPPDQQCPSFAEACRGRDPPRCSSGWGPWTSRVRGGSPCARFARRSGRAWLT
eukprot:4875921-Alexandrium_andersonii.AAC.1